MRLYREIRLKASNSWEYTAMDYTLYDMIEGNKNFKEAARWAADFIKESDDVEAYEDILKQEETIKEAYKQWLEDNPQ